MFDVLSLGNALVDCFLTLSHPDQHCRIETTTGEICFPFGAKIPVSNVSFLLGGNACNVSVGISRLSLKAGLVAEIGDDMLSVTITDGLRKENVDVSLVKQVKGASSFAVGINGRGDRTLFVEHVDRDHAFSFAAAETKWLYVTSLGKEWHQAYQQAALFAKEQNLQIAFNPGTPQFEAGTQSYKEVLTLSSLLFVNADEAQMILGKKSTQMEELLFSLQERGPETVVITDGKHGSYAINRMKKIEHVGIIEAPVIERTGAGDAYSAGFLSAIIAGKDLRTAMQWGTVNAASVIGKVGAQEGLLTRVALEERAAREY